MEFYLFLVVRLETASSDKMIKGGMSELRMYVWAENYYLIKGETKSYFLPSGGHGLISKGTTLND